MCHRLDFNEKIKIQVKSMIECTLRILWKTFSVLRECSLILCTVPGTPYLKYILLKKYILTHGSISVTSSKAFLFDVYNVITDS